MLSNIHTQTLALADLEGLTEAEIKQNIANNYAGSVSGFNYGSPSDAEIQELLSLLDGFDVLIAYESVGSFGCDSSSWFLLHNKATGMLVENHGSHCSCFGFEGQWAPEETTLEYIASDKFSLSTGGYDYSAVSNEAAVKEYVRAIIKERDSHA